MDNYGWGDNLTVGGEAVSDSTTNDTSNYSTSDNEGWGSGLTVSGADSVDDYNMGNEVSLGTMNISFSVSSYLTIDGHRYESADGLPIQVRATGGTTNTNDSGCWVSIGADTVNPNRNLLAKSVTIEITYKDSRGSIVDIGRDTIYYIDPEATFHFGTEHYIDSRDVRNFTVNAYCNDFYRVDRSLMSSCRLDDITYRTGSWGDMELFGNMYNSSGSIIEWCTGYIQFLNADGSIAGGCSCFVDLIPARQSRPVKTSCSVPIRASRYITSVDFSL